MISNLQIPPHQRTTAKGKAVSIGVAPILMELACADKTNVFTKLKTSPGGLSRVMAEARLAEYGPNAVAMEKQRGWLWRLQEGRAQATLAALKSRLALNASVRRDNCWATVPAAGLVPGDIVKLSLGAVVAADVRLIEGEILLDQSMLTGESIPIEAGPGLQTYASVLATCGIAMARLPLFLVGGTLVAATVFAVILDFAKVPVFNRLNIA
jgi:hypothetical protein